MLNKVIFKFVFTLTRVLNLQVRIMYGRNFKFKRTIVIRYSVKYYHVYLLKSNKIFGKNTHISYFYKVDLKSKRYT